MQTAGAMKADSGELRAAGAMLGVAGLYMAVVLGTGLVPTGQFVQLFSVYAQSLGALTLAAGGIALFVECGRRARREGAAPSPFGVIRAFVALRWQRDRFLSLAVPPLVCATMLATFNAFKQAILPRAGFHLDALFAAWDKALFLGADPWVVTHKVLSGPAATLAVDSFYHGWFVPMTLGVIVCAYLRDSHLRTQYVLSYAVSWILIGSVLAWLLPAAGPCFYDDFAGGAPTFTALMDTLAGYDRMLVAEGGTGLAALKNQQALLNHFGGSGPLVLGGGISAMPSMHNALAVLFALGGMRINRVLGWVMWIYAMLIWIGSIHLGWHYAIDGIAAVVLVVLIWYACGRAAAAMLAARQHREPVLALAE
ncbi:MAG: phosphatase PAP2 family protein [Sphingomonadaceae bacterium]|nr:phosphatase PAP2 family protein [Sphingomonadaceae bacterium]